MAAIDRLLSELDFGVVHQEYDERTRVHRRLRRLLAALEVDAFVQLALGIEDPYGNFSARDHGLGPRILAETPARRVFDLAGELLRLVRCEDVLDLVRRADIPYLKIGVGTELGSLLRPAEFWITNVRTLWAHLVMKHGGSVNRANDELALYRDSERDSEMEYAVWGDLHRNLEPAMRSLGAAGAAEASAQGLEAPPFDFLWADAVANALYELRESV